MLKKIVSGGQTGADQAALDVAIEMGIPHGGWIPKGRKTEKGRLPKKYRLKETNAIDYAQSRELNVIDSDSTLVFSHGELKRGAALTQKLARKHHKPCLHIDLDRVTEYKAVEIIKAWIHVREIKVLNIAGSRASKDLDVYDDVRDVLRSVLYPPPESIARHVPLTVQEAVDKLVITLPIKEKTSISRMEEGDLGLLYPTLGEYIRKGFDLGSGNEELMQSCRYILKTYAIHEDEAVALIIREFWKKLMDTHQLRIIK